jgi:hypothetical protein
MKFTDKNIILKPFEELRLDKLDVLTKLGKGEYFQNVRRPLLAEKINFCIEWLDLEKGDLDEVTVKSIDQLYTEIVKIIATHKPQPPRRSIRINGVKYKFVKRGFFMLYRGQYGLRGKGTKRHNKEPNKRTRQGIYKRLPTRRLFKPKQFFFAEIQRVSKRIKSINGSADDDGEETDDPTKPSNKRSRETDEIDEEPPFAWESLVHLMADFYGVQWDTVSNWNVLKFYHRFEYLKYYKKRQK